MSEEITFGVWLRKQRRSLDLTQQALADQVGCARITLRRIENGALKPSQTLALLLLEKVGILEEERPRWAAFARGRANFPTTQIPSLEATPLTNLPAPITTFIGREKEQVEIFQLIHRHRLVTLTGSGGVGKTRLSLKIGSQALGDFSHGVWLVELASLSDPALLSQTIAKGFGLATQSDTPFTEILIKHLRPKSLLLILDNCEHLLDACAPLIDALLKNCPNIKIIVTSREPLGITGEALYRVPSLQLPDFQKIVENFRNYESVRLFEERAQLVQTDFSLTMENASFAAHICSRLDGIPLALELAAAKVYLFSTKQIAEQLDQSFNLLTGGSRTALPRQQTIRASIDWSWSLLTGSEQTFMRQLSIFAGGWILESAQAVCGGDVLELTSSLVKKSLIVLNQESGGETRYRFHETIRQYALEKLVESGEEEQVRNRHMSFFSKWIEILTATYKYPQSHIWLNLITVELDNLRATLEWALSNDLEVGIQVLAHIQEYWRKRGFWVEFMDWSQRFFSKPAILFPRTPYCVKVMTQAGILAMFTRHMEDAKTWHEKSLKLGIEIDDKAGIIATYLGMGRLEREFGKSEEVVRDYFEKSLDLAYSINDKPLIVEALVLIGESFVNDDEVRARKYFEESLHVAREENFTSLMIWPLGGLGGMCLLNGELDRACDLLHEGLLYLRLERRKDGLLDWILLNLTETYLRLGDSNRAQQYLDESKKIHQDIGSDFYAMTSLEALYLIWVKQEYNQAYQACLKCYHSYQRIHDPFVLPGLLLSLAELAFQKGLFELGVRLLGNMESDEFNYGKPMYPLYRKDVERNLALARPHLDGSKIEAILSEGHQMSLDEAVAYGLKEMQ